MNHSEIKEALEDAGYETRSYSGRCMYGKSCLGVVTRDSSAKVVLAVVNEFIRTSALEPEATVDAVSDLCNTLEAVSGDSMGRSSIIYWEDIEWQSDSDETDSDDE